jgi:hypothetical protein
MLNSDLCNNSSTPLIYGFVLDCISLCHLRVSKWYSILVSGFIRLDLMDWQFIPI